MREREKRARHAPHREEQHPWREVLTKLFSGGQRYSLQALQGLLRIVGERGLVNPETLGMMEGTLRIADHQVRDIMVPRIHMHVLRENSPIEEWLKVVTDSGHSRFPVLKGSPEQVTGILLAKDLLTLVATGEIHAKEVRDRIRRPCFVPESKRLNSLLREFRESRNHIAIVIDEYGSISGLVTIEDIIEEIVGEIEDEHDREAEAHIRPDGDNRFEIDGLTPIQEFKEYFNTQLEDGDYDTVGGLVLKQFGRMPEAGECFELDDLRFEVLQANKRRVMRVGLSRIPTTHAKTDTITSEDNDN